MSADQSRWTPKPLSTLAPHQGEHAWVWKGYIVKRAITLLVALWKAGKTTLLLWLVKALRPDGSGEFAGQGVVPSHVLIVTEESEGLWRQRRDQLGLGDHVEIISRPFLARCDRPTWEEFVRYVASLVAAGKYDLVIFDTLPNLWPVDDENDSAKAITALTPLHAITEAGAALVLSAHPKKGDAGEGQAMRGAGATPGFVDIIVEMRRYDAKQRSDNRRTLTAYSRYDDTPSELVLDYDPKSGYRVVGTKQDSAVSDRLDVVCQILAVQPFLTVREILEAWPTGDVVCPGHRTLTGDLDDGGDAAGIERTGKGVKGDPHRFHLADSIPASSTSDGSERKPASDSIPASSDTPGKHAGKESVNGHETTLPPRSVPPPSANASPPTKPEASIHAESDMGDQPRKESIDRPCIADTKERKDSRQ